MGTCSVAFLALSLVLALAPYLTLLGKVLFFAKGFNVQTPGNL